MKKPNDLDKYKILGIGIVPVMVGIIVITLIVIAAYEILFF